MKKVMLYLSAFFCSVVIAETMQSLDNKSNAKNKDLDYLLKDSDTKFPISDYIWQKDRENENIHEYFNKAGKDIYPKLVGYDSNGNPIYVNEKGEVVDANGQLILKNGKPISVEELKQLTLQEKIQKQKEKIKVEEERLRQQSLKQKKIAKQQPIQNKKPPINTQPQERVESIDEMEKRLAQEYLRKTMEDIYGTRDNQNISEEQRFIYALLQSQRTKAKQKESVKNIYGDSSFSNQENIDQATNEHKLYRTITAGKIIPAILLIPINSQIEGIVSAQIEQDIYAAMGRAVLIPRGSKVIGFYKNDNSIGQNRLAIAWREIITPQGVNILLTNAIAGDSEGYAGVKGHLNNKYWQRYGMGIALETLANAGTLAISNLTQSDSSNAGSAYYTGQLLSQSQNEVNQALRQIIQNQQQIKPQISIKAGSRIYIMPSAHIWFPVPKNNEIMARYFDND